MIHILFLIDSLTGGGAEKVLQTLVNNMDQEKFRITVQTTEYENPEKYLAPGIRYKAICKARSAWGKTVFSWWLRLCAQLKWVYPLYIRENYDIEVAYLECGPTKFLWGSARRKTLKLAWVHCDLLQRRTPATIRQHRIYQSFDRVVCVSESVRNGFVSLYGPSPPACVLHNVNDETQIRERSNAFLPAVPPCFTFLSVGRLSKEKGVDRLLRACAELKQNGRPFHLFILGDGPDWDRLHALRRQLRLEHLVTFLGYQKNPYPYMKAANCIVCASHYEGMSTVTTEALILGKPFLTTSCAGMAELLGDSEYGLIVNNSTEGIYRGMQRMLEDPDLCKHYEQTAAQRGQQFSKAAAIAQTEQFLIHELKRKRSGL